MYRMGRRWAGVAAGLLAAGIFAFTPVAASMFGHSMEDGALVMCVVLAADCWQREVMGAGLRSLVWAGEWGGGGGSEVFGGRFGPETGWLYPLSLLALGAGLVAWRGASRADPVRAGFVMWGLWLATFGVVFSEMGVVLHTAYVASLAPPAAALSGAGAVMFWRWYRAGDQQGLLLPLTVVAELAWAKRPWSYFPRFPPCSGAGARGAAAGGAPAVAASRGGRARCARPGAHPAYAGPSFDAIAGPYGRRSASAIRGSVTAPPGGTDKRIYAYVSPHRDGAR